MKILKHRRINYKRRLALLKSMRDRVYVKITNRSAIIQVIAAGFCKRGDVVKSTYLYHKYMDSASLNVTNLTAFAEKIFTTLELHNTILDLGSCIKGTRHMAIAKVYKAHKV